jgi:hypothetical protein
MSAVTLHFHDDAVGVASVGPLFVSVWRGETTAARMHRVFGIQRTLWSITPQQAMVTVIEPTTPVVGAEERELGIRLYRETSPHLVATGYVIEGTGFFAAAARGVIATTRLLLRPPFPMQAFARVDDTARWIAPIATASISPLMFADVSRAVLAARAYSYR